MHEYITKMCHSSHFLLAKKTCISLIEKMFYNNSLLKILVKMLLFLLYMLSTIAIKKYLLPNFTFQSHIL